MISDKNLDKLLEAYRLWAYITLSSCVVFALLLTLGIRSEKTHPFVPLAILLSGFLWIGTSAFCRHSYVALRAYIGKRVGTLEFLSTNLVVILFPVTYWKIKKEVELFKIKNRTISP
jgi:hypothetical protein